MLKCGMECKWHIAEYCSRSYPNLNPNSFLHFSDNSNGSQALAQQQEADAGPVLSYSFGPVMVGRHWGL